MQIRDLMRDTSSRVEKQTDESLNRAIRQRVEADLMELEGASRAQVSGRLEELSEEWDIERVLQLNASVVAGLGFLLASRLDRRFLLLPAAVFSFLLQHALQGWCPPLPIFRRLGARTTREIERHRYAVKALRGDFDDLPPPGRASSVRRVRAVLNAIDA
jgi:hypothetical protein